MDAVVYERIDCDSFFEYVDNDINYSCQQQCWEAEDCAANNTWFEYCIKSTCYDNCTWETTCVVDWYDQNHYGDTTDCDAFDAFYSFASNDTFDGECVYECAWTYDCRQDFDWFDICDRYDCYDNCTSEYECIVDW